MQEIKVLDRGFVRLVDSMPAIDDVDRVVTEGTDEVPDLVYLGPGDQRIVQAARVSYGHGTKTVREDAGLIRYLVRNKHTSPLEQVVFTFHVKCPISVARQWQRHRTWSYNEVSTRYSEVEEDEYYLPTPERFCAQDTKNRQGSGERFDPHLAEVCSKSMEITYKLAMKQYRALLKAGLSRETARGILPLDTYTQFYGTVSLHNLLRFLELRLDPHAQWEISQYGRALLELVRPVAPVTVAAWEENYGKDKT